MQYPKGYVPYAKKSEDGRYRYALTIDTPYPKQPLSLFVLMMNPSTADGEESDRTINTLLRNLGHRYRQIVVVNTTPLIETDSHVLRQRVAEIEAAVTENARIVATMMHRTGDCHLLVATGNLIKHVNVAPYVELMNTIATKQLYVIQLTKAGYGSHPLYKATELFEHLTPVEPSDAQWHLRPVNSLKSNKI